MRAVVCRECGNDAAVGIETLPAPVVDEHGVRISSLIVTRLRFERLLNGSRRAGEWFQRDPSGFTAAFKRYQDAVEPTASFAQDEARAFELWCASQAPSQA